MAPACNISRLGGRAPAIRGGQQGRAAGPGAQRAPRKCNHNQPLWHGRKYYVRFDPGETPTKTKALLEHENYCIASQRGCLRVFINAVRPPRCGAAGRGQIDERACCLRARCFTARTGLVMQTAACAEPGERCASLRACPVETWFGLLLVFSLITLAYS